VYAVGQTSGALAGPNAGENDNFVIKYDSAGNLQWKRQIGTTSDETFNGVWADPAGNVYAAGWTRAALGGPGSGGLADAMLVKFNAAGDHLWSMQLGSADRDAANDVFGDAAGNIYLAGNSRGSWGGPNAGGADAVLVKLSAPPAAVVANNESTSALTALAPQTVGDGGGAKLSSARKPATPTAHDAALASLPAERSFAPPRRTALGFSRRSEHADVARAVKLSDAALDAALARVF
jgi:hypothetical protein